MAARYVCVATADAVPAPASSVTYKEVDVIVLDDTGQPVEGAVISPNGWRIEPNGMGEAFREDRANKQTTTKASVRVGDM